MKDLKRGKKRNQEQEQSVKSKVTLLSVLTSVLVILLVWDFSSSFNGNKRALAKMKDMDKIVEVSDRLIVAKKESELHVKDVSNVKQRIEDKKQQELEEKRLKELEEQQKNMDVDQYGMKLGKVAYITFDDGPSTATPKILQLLDKYNAKATFFMIDPNMRNYPDYVKAMQEDGHVLGVHSVTHEVSKLYASPQSFIGEMDQSIQTVKDITGKDTKFLRAPYGTNPYVTPAYKAEVDKRGYLLWDWTIDSLDWKHTTGGFVQLTIDQIEQKVGKQGLVILMHERETTAAHLERLLKYLQNNGYSMEALTEEMTPFQF